MTVLATTMARNAKAARGEWRRPPRTVPFCAFRHCVPERSSVSPAAGRAGGSSKHWSAGYSYRYFSESASACPTSEIVSSGIRSWASVTSAEVGWASAGSHCSGFQAPLRRNDLGQCG